MSKSMPRGLLIAAALSLFAPALQAASPLAPPGDYRFRNDITRLRDAGLLPGPITTWPVSMPQLHAALSRFDGSVTALPPAVAAALARVRSRVRLARAGGAGADLSVRVAGDTQFLRSFADTPRGEREAALGLHWTGEHLAGELRLAAVDEDPHDPRNGRLDGSWIGGTWGNWMLAAGAIDRYWGPAWQGGLILGNNARPRPGLTLRRMRAEPFESWWLGWMGPWHLSVFVEQLERDRGVPEALFAGMRFAFAPLQSLEIGISRSSQFGGEGRHLGLDTVINVITAQSTSTNPAVGSAKGINQLGGFDLRWRLPLVNAALFWEMIGEDESGSRPDLWMGQGGLELWGGLGAGGGGWRLILERADTKAHILESSESSGNGVAYNNSDFATGYRYRGRVLGHTAEGDALLNSARLLLDLRDGSFLNLAYLDGTVNRTVGALALRNTLTTGRESVRQLELSWQRQFRFGRLEFGLGRTERDPSAGEPLPSDDFAWLGFDRRF